MTKTNTKKTVAVGSFLGLFAAPALFAQAPNAGVTEIVTAINGLAPDVTTIVIAGISLGIIVLGAIMAWKVAKRFLG